MPEHVGAPPPELIWSLLVNPEEMPPTPGGVAAERHLRVGVHDISDPQGCIHPAVEHLEEVVDFLRRLGSRKRVRVQIHCYAGSVSRSMATALIGLVVKAPGRQAEAASGAAGGSTARPAEPENGGAGRRDPRLRRPAGRGARGYGLCAGNPAWPAPGPDAVALSAAGPGPFRDRLPGRRAGRGPDHAAPALRRARKEPRTAGWPDHDDVTELLIRRLASAEAAVADALCPDADSDHPRLAELRAAAWP